TWQQPGQWVVGRYRGETLQARLDPGRIEEVDVRAGFDQGLYPRLVDVDHVIVLAIRQPRVVNHELGVRAVANRVADRANQAPVGQDEGLRANAQPEPKTRRPRRARPAPERSDGEVRAFAQRGQRGKLEAGAARDDRDAEGAERWSELARVPDHE